MFYGVLFCGCFFLRELFYAGTIFMLHSSSALGLYCKKLEKVLSCLMAIYYT